MIIHVHLCEVYSHRRTSDYYVCTGLVSKLCNKLQSNPPLKRQSHQRPGLSRTAPDWNLADPGSDPCLVRGYPGQSGMVLHGPEVLIGTFRSLRFTVGWPLTDGNIPVWVHGFSGHPTVKRRLRKVPMFQIAGVIRDSPGRYFNPG